MRCTYFVLAAGTGVLLFLSGCQHLPPQPLNLDAFDAALRERELDVEPVQAYAKALQSHADAALPAFDTSDGLSPAEAAAVALWYNPQLRIARLEAVRAGAAQEAGAPWADPVVEVSGGKKRDTGNAPRIERSWVSMASLSITIPLSGRLEAERSLLTTQSRMAALKVVEQEWETVTALRAAWAEWWAARERVALLSGYMALFGRFEATASSLAHVGEIAPSSGRLFRIEHTRIAAELEGVRAQETEARTTVLGLLGLLPDASVPLTPTLPVVLEVADTLKGVAGHPRIARLRAAYQAAEDRLRVEIRKQYPDITFSPAYTGEEDETQLTLGLGYPAPVWNLNRRGIAEAAADRDIARARAEAAYQELLTEAAQARVRMAGYQAQRQHLAETVAPTVDAQVAETLSLLAIGEIDIILVYEALTQALLVKRQLIDATLAGAKAAYRHTAATAAGRVAETSQTESSQ